MGGRQFGLLVQARSPFVSDTATDMSPFSRDMHLLLVLAGWPHPPTPHGMHTLAFRRAPSHMWRVPGAWSKWSGESSQCPLGGDESAGSSTTIRDLVTCLNHGGRYVHAFGKHNIYSKYHEISVCLRN